MIFVRNNQDFYILKDVLRSSLVNVVLLKKIPFPNAETPKTQRSTLPEATTRPSLHFSASSQNLNPG